MIQYTLLHRTQVLFIICQLLKTQVAISPWLKIGMSIRTPESVTWRSIATTVTLVDFSQIKKQASNTKRGELPIHFSSVEEKSFAFQQQCILVLTSTIEQLIGYNVYPIYLHCSWEIMIIQELTANCQLSKHFWGSSVKEANTLLVGRLGNNSTTGPSRVWPDLIGLIYIKITY